MNKYEQAKADLRLRIFRCGRIGNSYQAFYLFKEFLKLNKEKTDE